MTSKERLETTKLAYDAVLGSKQAYITFINGISSGILTPQFRLALGEMDLIRFIYLANMLVVSPSMMGN